MTTEKFLPYARQSIDETDIQGIVEALRCDTITRGDRVRAFEEAIAKMTGAGYAVAFSNGSAALTAAYQALNGTSSDQVVTSPNSFIATVAEAKRLGMSLRYTDIDSYGNMDLASLDDVIHQPRSRGRMILVPVHFAGVSVDMAALSNMIKTPNVAIIEDAAHALGSFYPDGSPVGSCRYSDMTVFSFHPSKNITTGEGGMVTTNSEELMLRLQKIRNSGIERNCLRYLPSPQPYYYEVDELSSNSHMTEFQAALGLSQLAKLDAFRKKKHELVAAYRKKLTSIPGIQQLPSDADSRTMHHLFVIKVAFQELGIAREVFMEELKKRGIGTQYHYVPMYYHPALGTPPKTPKDVFPAMEKHFATALSLPFFVDMEEDDVDRVCRAIRQVVISYKPA